MHMGAIMSAKTGMAMGTFKSKYLAPTAAEYLAALEAALFPAAAAAAAGGGGGGRGMGMGDLFAGMFGGAGGGGRSGGPVKKPAQIAVDEQSAVPRLKAVLAGAAGINVSYYPPPTDEELSAMGVPH